MIDSVQKIDADKSYGIDIKSYARQKLPNKNSGVHLTVFSKKNIPKHSTNYHFAKK